MPFLTRLDETRGGNKHRLLLLPSSTATWSEPTNLGRRLGARYAASSTSRNLRPADVL
jgi:hypothetical protein